MKRVLLFLAFVAMWQNVFAYDFSAVVHSGQRLYFEIVNSSYVKIVPPAGSYKWIGYAAPIGALTIPDSITYSGVTYPIKEIGYEAFSTCTSLTSVTMGNVLQFIRSLAFGGCRNLAFVVIGSSVESIGSDAFYGCYIDTVHLYRNTPPSLGYDSYLGAYPFDPNTNRTRFILHNCSLSTYRNATGWSSYGLSIQYPSVNYTTSVQSTDTCRGNVSSHLYRQCDSTQIITATPNNNYHLLRWSNGRTINPDTLQWIPGEVITAFFVGCIIETNDSAMGIVSREIVGNRIEQLTAIPSEGFKFVRWSDGVNQNPRTLTLTQDTSITAIFDTLRCSIVGTPATGFTYSTDFEQAAGDNSWTIVNGTGNTNKWFIGSLGSGNRALYISSDGGQNNTYSTRSSSAVFAYTTLTLPEGQHVYSYDWRCNGEGNFDYLRVALIPNSATLSTSGWTYNSLPTGAIALDGESRLRGQSTWQTKSGVANVPSAGTYKVVFFWRNDNSGGSNPPAAVDNFSIGSATATLANSGTVTGSDTVDYLETVTLTAVPNYGYHFTQWHDGVTINPREVVAICNSVFYAIFDYDQFTLNVASSDTMQGTADGDGSYNYLSSRTIQATANTGYHFTQWSDGNTDNPRVVVLTRDTSFIAQFAPNQYTLTGSASYSERGTVEGLGAYNYLDTATLIAVPNHGYRFSRWGDNNYDNPRQVVVTQDKSYTAYFDYDQFSITLSVDDPVHGSVSGEGTYNYLANRTVRATENSGYYFAHWSDGSTANPYTFTLTSDTSLTAHYYALQVDSEDASKGSVSQTREGYCSAHIQATARTGYHFLQWSDGSTQNPRTVTLTQDTMITAYFAPNQYTLILRSSDVSLGSVSGGGTFDYGTEITISATVTAEHYHFAGWSDYSTENPRQYTILRDATLTAYFEIDRHTVAVQSSDITMGQVEGGGVFAYGQPCTVSATPYSGYEFVNWSDGSPYNPYTFAVQRDMVLTANFAPVGTHTYTITAVSDNTAMGTVSGGGTFASGTVATLTAIPAVGYQFDRWQDGNRDNPRTVTVTGNATYTAYFAETVGIEDVADGEGVRVWSYDGRIHVVGAEGMDVNVYDILGRRVSGKRKVVRGKLELAVPAGVYLVRIGDLPARKVVVIRS